MHYHYLWFLVVIALIAGAFCYAVLTAAFRKIRLKKRFRLGAAGEVSAKAYLLKHKYTILAEQQLRIGRMRVNNEIIEFAARADFLAEKKGRQFVVEVKTGEKATDPSYTATRRQIFEYFHLFGIDGMLLFDADNERLMEISFESSSGVAANRPSRAIPFFLGFLTALILIVVIFLLK